MRRLASIFLLLILAGGARAERATEGLPEAWKGFFYRAPGNTASVQVAPLHPAIWTSTLTGWKGARVLTLFRGTSKSFTAKASLIFHPTADAPVDATAAAKALMEKTKQGSAYLEEMVPVRPYEVGDLRGAGGMLAGDDEAGVRVHVVIAVYADGKDSVATIYQAGEAELQRDTAVVMQSVLDTLRIGEKVRTPLAAKRPETPLAGIYEGPGHAMLVFDANGYVSRAAPFTELEEDLELLSQARPDQVAAYTRAGDALAWTFAGAETKATLDGRKLTIGKDVYVRIDDLTAGVKLAGRWQSDEHVLELTSGGAATLDGHRAAWRLEGSRLIIDYATGARDWRPLHPHVGPDGKVAADVIHVGPRTYTRVSK